MSAKPKNYDYTGSARKAAQRARTALRLDVALDAEHAECVRYITDVTGETPTALARRLFRDEAARLGAPTDEK